MYSAVYSLVPKVTTIGISNRSLGADDRVTVTSTLRPTSVGFSARSTGLTASPPSITS